jgi:hypothetical protein
MTDIRYAPPAAAVADAFMDSGPRPQQVTVAVRLAWTSFVLGLPIALYLVAQSPVAMSVVMLLMGVLVITIYRALARGRNWARIALTVLLVLSLIDLFVPSELPAGLMILSRATLVLDVVVVVLLFRRESGRWFRPPVATQ